LRTVFRRSGQIKAVLKPHVRKAPTAPVKAILQTAVAQIVFMDVPPHAAVGEAVEVLKSNKNTRGFANFGNAVLRKVVEHGKQHAAASPPKANIPGWIRGEWERSYGRIPMTKIAVQLIKDPVLDLTVTAKREDLAEATGGTPIGRQTLRLKSIGDVTALPDFEAGTWWAQDVSAAQPAQILMDQFETIQGKSVLDMCAAPGGKTLQLASAGANVTALDKSGGRLKRLEENLARTKLSAKVINTDALDFESEPFDAVLLDAPCSATGTFRRHPDVRFVPYSLMKVCRVSLSFYKIRPILALFRFQAYQDWISRLIVLRVGLFGHCRLICQSLVEWMVSSSRPYARRVEIMKGIVR